MPYTINLPTPSDLKAMVETARAKRNDTRLHKAIARERARILREQQSEAIKRMARESLKD